MDARVRRRRLAIAAVALAALVAGVAAGSGAGEGEPARRGAAAAATVTPAPSPPPPIRRLPATKLVGSTIILRFNGPRVPGHVFRALRSGRAAGAILFPDNAPSPAAVRAVTRTLHRAARGKAIIGTDQEGGTIRRLSWAAPVSWQSARGTELAAAAAARASGRDLHAAGVTVTFAPVADLRQGIMRRRAFPGDPARAARLTAAAVGGYRGTGVAPTVKHFPGLGGATANTDDAPAVVSRSARSIGANDLPPFRAAIKAGVPLIMLSHARYPALDRDHIASQSKAITRDLLRGRLGFRGVTVTDAIEARAVTALSGPGEAAVRSMRAGNDLILTTRAGSHARVLRAMTAEARRSPSFRRRLAEAAARVEMLR